jgi:hypothetical protein
MLDCSLKFGRECCCWKKAIAAESDWNSEHVARTGKLSFDDKDILPVRRFSMEALVDSEVFVLQGEYLISLHVGED